MIFFIGVSTAIFMISLLLLIKSTVKSKVIVYKKIQHLHSAKVLFNQNAIQLFSLESITLAISKCFTYNFAQDKAIVRLSFSHIPICKDVNEEKDYQSFKDMYYKIIVQKGYVRDYTKNIFATSQQLIITKDGLPQQTLSFDLLLNNVKYKINTANSKITCFFINYKLVIGFSNFREFSIKEVNEIIQLHFIINKDFKVNFGLYKSINNHWQSVNMKKSNNLTTRKFAKDWFGVYNQQHLLRISKLNFSNFFENFIKEANNDKKISLLPFDSRNAVFVSIKSPSIQLTKGKYLFNLSHMQFSNWLSLTKRRKKLIIWDNYLHLRLDIDFSNKINAHILNYWKQSFLLVEVLQETELSFNFFDINSKIYNSFIYDNKENKGCNIEYDCNFTNFFYHINKNILHRQYIDFHKIFRIIKADLLALETQIAIAHCLLNLNCLTQYEQKFILKIVSLIKKMGESEQFLFYSKLLPHCKDEKLYNIMLERVIQYSKSWDFSNYEWFISYYLGLKGGYNKLSFYPLKKASFDCQILVKDKILCLQKLNQGNHILYKERKFTGINCFEINSFEKGDKIIFC